MSSLFRHLPSPTRIRGFCRSRQHLRTLRVLPTTHKLQQLQGRHGSNIFRQQTRTFALSSIHPILLPPVVFLGLLISLWTWKSIVTILFQDKIIYMPYMPPFARAEKFSTYTRAAHPVEWTEHTIPSLDAKTRLTLAIGTIPSPSPSPSPNEIIICYFQGNASSIPPRIPLLSSVLKLLSPPSPPSSSANTKYTLAALSYRGYWTSTGRPTQSGIERDASAFLSHLVHTYPDATFILWGQSVGAGVACCAAARFLQHQDSTEKGRSRIVGLILETPFTSIHAMLLAVYESRWLPYRYLGRFLWNTWDAEGALREVAGRRGRGRLPRVLLLPAGKDESVPREEAGKLEELCRGLGFEVQRRDVRGAYHTEATTKREGQIAVAQFIQEVAEASRREEEGR